MTTVEWGRTSRLPRSGRIVVALAEGPGHVVQLSATAARPDGSPVWVVDSDRPTSPGGAASVGRSRDSGLPALSLALERLGPDVDRVVVTLGASLPTAADEGRISATVSVEGRTAYLPELRAPAGPREIVTLAEVQRRDGWLFVAVGERHRVGKGTAAQAVVRAPPAAVGVGEAPGPRSGASARRASRSRSRRLAVVSVLLLAIAGVGFALLRLSQDESHGRFADPAKVSLPAVEDGEATAAYLRGEGAAAVRLVELTTALAEGDASQSTCQDLIENGLPNVGDPPDLLGLAAGIPDRATSEMAVEDLRAVVGVLQQCSQGETADTDRLRFARTVLVRRLQELGVR